MERGGREGGREKEGGREEGREKHLFTAFNSISHLSLGILTGSQQRLTNM